MITLLYLSTLAHGVVPSAPSAGIVPSASYESQQEQPGGPPPAFETSLVTQEMSRMSEQMRAAAEARQQREHQALLDIMEREGEGGGGAGHPHTQERVGNTGQARTQAGAVSQDGRGGGGGVRRAGGRGGGGPGRAGLQGRSSGSQGARSGVQGGRNGHLARVPGKMP